MGIINCASNSETAYFSELNCASGSEFKYTSEVDCASNSETVILKEIECPGNSEFYVFDESVYDTLTFQNNLDPETEYLKYVAPFSFVEAKLNTGGIITDYTPYIHKCRLVKTLGGKTYVEFTMVECETASEFMENILKLQATTINPLYSGLCSSPFSSPFQSTLPDPETNPNYYVNGIKNYFVVKLAIGYGTYQEYTYAYMVPSDWSFDGTELTLRCEDFTVLLEQEGQSMKPDINADAGVIYSAHSAIREILSRYGVGNVVIKFPDFTVRLLRRTEDKPLNWIDMICKIYQAKRRWVGSTLYLEPTLTVNELAPKWNLIEGQHIIEGSFKVNIDLSQYKNKFTISRTSPNGGVIGEQECIGFDCPGRTGNITFDTPVNYASAVEEVTNGAIENYVYFTEKGTPVNDSIDAGPNGKFILTTTPVKSVRFTYRANIGTTSFGDGGSSSQGGLGGVGGFNYGQQFSTFSYTPRYKVTFYGKKNGSTGIDTEYKFSAVDSAGVACLGLHQEYSNIEDPIIPNTGVAQAYASALLKESTRKVLMATLETPFINPFIEPGDCVSISDYELNFTNVKWLVEETEITIDGDDAVQTLRLTRGIL